MCVAAPRPDRPAELALLNSAAGIMPPHLSDQPVPAGWGAVAVDPTRVRSARPGSAGEHAARAMPRGPPRRQTKAAVVSAGGAVAFRALPTLGTRFSNSEACTAFLTHAAAFDEAHALLDARVRDEMRAAGVPLPELAAAYAVAPCRLVEAAPDAMAAARMPTPELLRAAGLMPDLPPLRFNQAPRPAVVPGRVPPAPVDLHALRPSHAAAQRRTAPWPFTHDPRVHSDQDWLGALVLPALSYHPRLPGAWALSAVAARVRAAGAAGARLEVADTCEEVAAALEALVPGAFVNTLSYRRCGVYVVTAPFDDDPSDLVLHKTSSEFGYFDPVEASFLPAVAAPGCGESGVVVVDPRRFRGDAPAGSAAEVARACSAGLSGELTIVNARGACASGTLRAGCEGGGWSTNVTSAVFRAAVFDELHDRLLRGTREAAERVVPRDVAGIVAAYCVPPCRLEEAREPAAWVAERFGQFSMPLVTFSADGLAMGLAGAALGEPAPLADGEADSDLWDHLF